VEPGTRDSGPRQRSSTQELDQYRCGDFPPPVHPELTDLSVTGAVTRNIRQLTDVLVRSVQLVLLCLVTTSLFHLSGRTHAPVRRNISHSGSIRLQPTGLSVGTWARIPLLGRLRNCRPARCLTAARLARQRTDRSQLSAPAGPHPVNDPQAGVRSPACLGRQASARVSDRRSGELGTGPDAELLADASEVNLDRRRRDDIRFALCGW
jgi:hypothetical protein